jgi:hypothetical protein
MRLTITALGILAILTHTHLLGGGDERTGTPRRGTPRLVSSLPADTGATRAPSADFTHSIDSASVVVAPPVFNRADIEVLRIRWGARPEVRNVHRKGR